MHCIYGVRVPASACLTVPCTVAPQAATYSAALGRLVQQMDELQAWLQSSSEGRALSPEDARTTVDALEKVEECLRLPQP